MENETKQSLGLFIFSIGMVLALLGFNDSINEMYYYYPVIALFGFIIAGFGLLQYEANKF